MNNPKDLQNTPVNKSELRLKQANEKWQIKKITIAFINDKIMKCNVYFASS